MARIKNRQYELLGDSMKLYVEASSKKSLIQRLAAGEEISGYNYSMFGGGGRYMLDDNLADGTIIAIYSKMVQGNPVAKSWGTWTNKVLKSESFNTEARPTGDGVLFYPSDNHVCDFCNIRTPFARIMDENPDSDGSYEDEWGGSYKFICQICAELMSQFQAEYDFKLPVPLGSCDECGTDIEEDDDEFRTCDLCEVLLCGGCNRRCEGCSNTVCDSHRCSEDCCDGAYCDECHEDQHEAESFSADSEKHFKCRSCGSKSSDYKVTDDEGTTIHDIECIECGGNYNYEYCNSCCPCEEQSGICKCDTGGDCPVHDDDYYWKGNDKFDAERGERMNNNRPCRCNVCDKYIRKGDEMYDNEGYDLYCRTCYKEYYLWEVLGHGAESFNADEEDMVSCNHCWNKIGTEEQLYEEETIDYEMANSEVVCVPCYKRWMKEYENDLDPHYTPFYAETFEAPYAFNDDRCDNCERSVIDEQDMIRIPIYIDDSEYDVCEVCYDKLIDTSNDFGQTYVSFEATNGWKVTCSKCGVQGHNKSTCGKTPKTYVRKTIKKDDAMLMTMLDQWHTGIRYTQRTGYIMGITGIIVGWFINNQFFCRK